MSATLILESNKTGFRNSKSSEAVLVCNKVITFFLVARPKGLRLKRDHTNGKGKPKKWGEDGIPRIWSRGTSRETSTCQPIDEPLIVNKVHEFDNW